MPRILDSEFYILVKLLLRNILALLARLTLRRYCPLVVGITGSVGKTSTKEAVFAVLAAKYRARRSEKNYNTEIGVPLTILGIPHHGRNVFKWVSAFIRVTIRVLIRDRNFPEILVLEMGADRPGDIGYLAGLAVPQIGVITAVGEVPVHVEFFASPAGLAEEKVKLIAGLPADGWAILNADDATVMSLRSRTRARLLSFGFGEGAAVRIHDYALTLEGEPGIRFLLAHGPERVGVALRNCFGRQQAYAAAAAACVSLALGLALREIAPALGGYTAPPGRLKLIRGNRGSLLLDDTYNASPAATEAALEVLTAMPARRRIAVLGDMLELGTYTESAHRAIGQRVAKAADVFIGVGERMKFALEAARATAAGRPFETHWFATSREAAQAIEALLRPSDLVLVKGSQSIRMERVVEEVMAEPQRAPELLVRQTVDWKERP